MIEFNPAYQVWLQEEPTPISKQTSAGTITLIVLAKFEHELMHAAQTDSEVLSFSLKASDAFCWPKNNNNTRCMRRSTMENRGSGPCREHIITACAQILAIASH
jgi:hypothetical protein